MIFVTRRSALLALFLAICLGLAPAAALAAGAPSSAASNAASNVTTNPLGALPSPPVTVPTQTATTAPAVVTTSSSAGGAFSGTDALLVAIGAIVVIGGIAYFIWSDSRHHVRLLRRAGAAAAGPATNGPGRGSKAPHKSRKLTPAERRRRKRGRAR